MATRRKPAAAAAAASPLKPDPTRPARAKKTAAPAPAEPLAQAGQAAAAAKPPKTAKPVKAAKPAKPEKPRKPKLVRDSFTIPKDEYEAIDTLKQRAAMLGRPSKKSELLRAGLKALAALGDAELLAALAVVPALKTGRPALA